MEIFKNITLHQGDCMEVMKSLLDNSYDLAICDPPYGIGAGDYQRGGTQYGKSLTVCKTYDRKEWDKMPPPMAYFRELRRVSKNQIIWGANHFISRMAYDSSCWIVWDKENGNNGYADCELAWTSFDKAVRKFQFRWQGMLQGNMKHKEQRIHPTQKPVALYGWLLNNFAKPGYKILDTHLGSGSICIAAHDLGFEMLGIELDPVYYNAAKQRLLYHQAQLGLF
jgi:site-specific DNA-methyltransferase (adenine-specific)